MASEPINKQLLLSRFLKKASFLSLLYFFAKPRSRGSKMTVLCCHKAKDEREVYPKV